MYLFMLPFLLAFSFSTFVRFVAIVFNVRVSFMRSFSLSFAFIWVLHTTNPFSDCFRVFCFLRARAFVVAVVVRHILFILLLLCAQCSPFTEFTIRFIFDVYMFVILFPFFIVLLHTWLWLSLHSSLANSLWRTILWSAKWNKRSAISRYIVCIVRFRHFVSSFNVFIVCLFASFTSSINVKSNCGCGGMVLQHRFFNEWHFVMSPSMQNIAFKRNALRLFNCYVGKYIKREINGNKYIYELQYTNTHTHTYSLLEIKSAVIACQNVHVQCIYEKQFTGEAFTLWNDYIWTGYQRVEIIKAELITISVWTCANKKNIC